MEHAATMLAASTHSHTHTLTACLRLGQMFSLSGKGKKSYLKVRLNNALGPGPKISCF